MLPARFGPRTVLGVTILLAAAVAGIFLSSLYGLRRSLNRETDEFLEGDAREFIHHLTEAGWSEALLRQELTHEVAWRPEQHRFFRLYDESGALRWSVPADLGDRWAPSPETIREVLAGHRQHLSHQAPGDHDRMSVVYPAPRPDGGYWACQAGMSLAQADERMVKYAYVFGGIALAILAAGAASAHLLVRRPLRRMHAIAAEAQEITTFERGRRLPVTGAGDEFDELARTLNAMLDRLAASVKGIERFAGDAAHELRGPVTRLRAAAEVALRRRALSDDEARVALADVIGHADRLSQLIRDLLFLVRQEEGLRPESVEPIDPQALIEETRSLYEGLASEKGLRLDVASAEAAAFRGQRMLLLRALGNLVENAIKFTGLGGRVEIAGRIEAGSYRFDVCDSGPGIAPEHLPHVFERFYRADASRSADGGAGLGLAIAQAVARAHGGDLAVDSTVGRGSCFTLTLPMSPSPTPAG